MADPGAGVDVVVAEGGAHQLLHQVGLFVGAAAGGDAADGVAPVLQLDAAEFAGCVVHRLFPADFLPGIADVLADHRLGDAVRVGRIAPGEAALDAGVAVVGLAVAVGNHAHQLLALHLGAEGAAHAAVGAGGDDAALRLAHFHHALFHQGGRRAGLHAGAAGHAFGVEEVLAAGRRHAGFEATAADGQGEGALGFLAGAHAAVADDALARVVVEIGVGNVLVVIQVVGAVVAVAHFAQADLAGHGLQLAVAVGGTGQAVQRVVGDVQLHHVAAQGGELGRLGVDHHALGHRRGAGGRVAAHAVDLDEAHAAGTEGFQAVGGAELGNGGAEQRRGAHHRGAGGHADLAAIDAQADLHLAFAGRGAEVDVAGGVEYVDHWSASEVARPKSAGKCLRALVTGKAVIPPRAQSEP
ncbi:hypothetical protein D9M68_307670 [compost metagenome]